MTSITGTIRIGEAQATMPATAKRQRGSILWFWGLMAALVIGAGLLGIGLSIPAKVDANLGFCIGMFAGLLLYAQWSKLFMVWRFRKTLTARGVPLEVAIRWDVAPEEIAYQIGDIVSRAPWRAATEIFHQKGWWIVMVQGTAWFAADRFFADGATARAFVGEVLSHMSEEARARSKEAVTFAANA